MGFTEKKLNWKLLCRQFCARANPPRLNKKQPAYSFSHPNNNFTGSVIRRAFFWVYLSGRSQLVLIIGCGYCFRNCMIYYEEDSSPGKTVLNLEPEHLYLTHIKLSVLFFFFVVIAFFLN